MKDLEFKILLKEKDIQYYTSKTVTLEKQNAGLRNEVYKVESEINKQNSIIYELKEEMKYCDDMKKEIAQLKSRIEKLKPIEMLLHGPVGNVREMVEQTTDPDVLFKYISVMKKMLTESSHKKKELRMTLKRLQEELTRVNTKCASLLDEQVELQEKLAFSEGKNMSLQQRVDELEELLGINENCNQVTKPRNIEAKNNVSKRNSLEGGVDREKYSQESPSKSPTYTKQRKGKICSTKDRISRAENDLFVSEMNLTSSGSSSGFAASAKRAKLSNGDKNILNKSETSKSTQFIIKKDRKVETSVSENAENVGVIDLT